MNKLFSSSNYLKLIGLSSISIMLSSCVITVPPPPPPEPPRGSSSKPSPPTIKRPPVQPPHPACPKLYNFYEQCYSLGIKEANTTKDCDTVANVLYQELNIGDRRFEKAISLFCGVACAEGVNRKGIASYSSFSRQYCRK